MNIKEKIKLTCKQCNKEFIVRISDKNRRFCSSECYWKSMVKQRNKLICKQCGIIFYSLRKNAKFCSNKCCNLYGTKGHKLNCECIACKAKRGETKGHFVSKETRDKIIKANIGHTVTQETRDKISKACIGKIISIEMRKKLSSYYKGKTYEEIHGVIKAFAIKRKHSLAAGGTGISGELTEYGSEFDSKLKEQIRFRDKYKCQECGCSQLENGKQLSIHHIDYDKENNNINNLIALCNSCHSMTNFNRKYWKKKLNKKINI